MKTLFTILIGSFLFVTTNANATPNPGIRCYSAHLPPITLNITFNEPVSSAQSFEFEEVLGSGAGPSIKTIFDTNSRQISSWPVGTYTGSNSSQRVGVLTITGVSGNNWVGTYSHNSQGHFLIQDVFCYLTN